MSTLPPLLRADEIKALALALGFDEAGIAGIDLAADEARLLEWLARGLHGELHYMERFGARRARPAENRPQNTTGCTGLNPASGVVVRRFSSVMVSPTAASATCRATPWAGTTTG